MVYTIVGIDTGKTAAIACLNLDGEIVRLEARPFAEFKWFIDTIRSTGIPAVIASDKKKNNDTIAKIASIFDSALYTPNEDISVMKKKEFAKELHVANIHERDALSAAIFAYNRYSSKLKQAERIAKGSTRTEMDRIKALVIKKHSISEAILHRKAGRFIR